MKVLWESRVALMFEPRDCWIGGYWDPRDRAFYFTLIPMLPLKVSLP